MSIHAAAGGRAAFAYEKALSARDQLSNKAAAEYKAQVKKIPMYIKANGLGATFAFILSKAKVQRDGQANSYQLIHDHTYEWFRQHKSYLLVDGNGNSLVRQQEFAAAIVRMDSPSYRAATAEVIAFFTWLRRYAEGLINT